jgi:hypothetical protein
MKMRKAQDKKETRANQLLRLPNKLWALERAAGRIDSSHSPVYAVADAGRVFKKVSLECEHNFYEELFDRKSNSVRQLWNNLNTVVSKVVNLQIILYLLLGLMGTSLIQLWKLVMPLTYISVLRADTLLSNRVNKPRNLDFSIYCHESQKNSMFLEAVCKQEILTEMLRLDKL